jgi:hypothetical protein
MRVYGPHAVVEDLGHAYLDRICSHTYVASPPQHRIAYLTKPVVLEHIRVGICEAHVR